MIPTAMFVVESVMCVHCGLLSGNSHVEQLTTYLHQPCQLAMCFSSTLSSLFRKSHMARATVEDSYSAGEVHLQLPDAALLICHEHGTIPVAGQGSEGCPQGCLGYPQGALGQMGWLQFPCQNLVLLENHYLIYIYQYVQVGFRV